MKRLGGLPLALASAGTTVAADRVAKIWAEHRLAAGPCRPDSDSCIDLAFGARFHLVYNHGAAFSTGTSLGPLFGLVAAVMTVLLLRLAATSPDRVRSLLFGLIAGGAFGNLVDRVVRASDGPLSGGVVDFVDVQWWPVFNVADAAVVVGVIMFLLYSMRQADTGDTDTGEADTGEADTGDAGSDDADAGDADADTAGSDDADADTAQSAVESSGG